MINLRCFILFYCYLLCSSIISSAQDQSAALDEAQALSQKAQEYYQKGDSLQALTILERAVAIREKALGPQHPATAGSLNNLALLYQSMGDYAKALPLYERSLAILEKSLGPQHPDTAVALIGLASLYQDIGDYAKALPLNERSLAIMEESLGPQHQNTAAALVRLGNLYKKMGDYAKALPLYERSLAITEKALGSQHRDTAGFLNNLALLYQAIGDNAKALPLYERSLAIREKALGPQHPDTAKALHNLAFLYTDMGDNAKALPLYERSLAINEKAREPQHPDTANTLNNLANLYQEMGDNAKALPLYERSLAIREKALGPQHPDTASTVNNLAYHYEAMGDNAKALPLYERSLAINEKTLGPQHPATAKALNNLAKYYYLQEDFTRARTFSARWASSIQQQLQKVLTMDERSRLSWQGAYLRFSVQPCVLRSEQMGQLVLRWKGIVLDSLIEDREMASAVSGDAEGQKKLTEIQQLRGSVSKLAFSDKQPDREQSEQIANRIADIERSLASRATILGRARKSANITLDAVLPALPDSCVLLDFFQYKDPKLNGKEARCYGALILAVDGEPKIVRIDGAEAIDQATAATRLAIAKGDEPALESSLKTLAEKLWAPLAAKFPPSTKTLCIGPDGALNFLSFAALPDTDGRFLAEKYEMVYVGSGRDLASPAAKDHNNQIALFANPVFDQSGMSSATNHVAMRSAEMAEFGQITLPQLPGTEVEGKSLVQEAEKEGWSATAYFGDQATEQQIRALKKPGILHLATHGFYLNAFTPSDDNTRGMKLVGLDQNKPVQNNGKGVDPMRASGIALTGAQATLKAWSEGKAPDPESDGILTAEEVAGLDLNGTWLVTLSACETGVGEIKSGEGVFGLRRAFMMAGAQNLLMTLWPVSDTTTADIMKDFYHRALVSGDAPRALADTQRDWLVKLRKENGLLAAVRDAGPFIMTTMGALPAQATFSAPQKSNFLR